MKMKFLAIGLALILPLVALSQTTTAPKQTTTPQKPAATTPAQKPATPPQQRPATTGNTPQKPVATDATTPATQSTTGTPQKTNARTFAIPDEKKRDADEAKQDVDGVTDAADATAKDKVERFLEEVEKGGGIPYREMLNEQERRGTDDASHRHFMEQDFENRLLSMLLWEISVAQKNGSKFRESRGVDVYLLTKEGVFLYDRNRHILQVISSDKDMRSRILTPESRFAEKAPLILVYVSDAKKQAKLPVGKKDFYAGMDCGIANQAVSLFCASENMITTTIEIDPVVVGKILELKAGDKALLAQPVGFR